MRKKRKKHAAAPSPRVAAPAPESALADLEAGRFREAISAYKTLVTQDPALSERLAEAYEGRARQLASKGMPKEALAMWENRALVGDAPVRLDHFTLLIRLGRLEEVLQLYRHPSLGRDAGLLGAMRAHLAARYLGGSQEFRDRLAAADPVRVDGQAASRALMAYCGGDDQGVTEALASIPFRSPYRDFAQILKALVRVAEAPEAAAEQLARIDPDSPFAGLASAARLALAPEHELTGCLRGVEAAARELVFALRGWPPERSSLWRELSTLGDEPSPKALTGIVQRHRQVLGEDWSRRALLKLMFQANLSGRARLMALRPTPSESLLLQAWQREEDEDPWDIMEGWERYAGTIVKEVKPRPGSDASLALAQVLRRGDRLMGTLDPQRAHGEGSGQLAQAAASQLELSLVYDPDDRGTYLRLIDHYRGTGALKESRRLLKQAQARWSADKPLLIAAMETALAGGAFKKAAGLGREILAVDPINTGVRERLVDAHLAHARKSLRGGRGDLATKALDEAVEWARGERMGDKLELLRGFVTMAEDEPAGLGRLRSLAERLGNGLAARLTLGAEAAQSGFATPALFAGLGWSKSPKVETDDLLDFLARLRAFQDGRVELPGPLLDSFSSSLKSAARLELERGQLETACETLARAGMHKARLGFARAALRRFPGEPVFELHAFEARHGDYGYLGIQEREIERLEQAEQRAREAGDMRLAIRLEEALDRVWDANEPPGATFLDGPPGGDIGALFAQMVGILGVEGVLEMIKGPGPLANALREVQRDLGAAAFRGLLESIARSPADFAGFPFPGPMMPSSPKSGRSSPRTGKGKGKRATPLDPDRFDLDLF